MGYLNYKIVSFRWSSRRRAGWGSNSVGRSRHSGAFKLLLKSDKYCMSFSLHFHIYLYDRQNKTYKDVLIDSLLLENLWICYLRISYLTLPYQKETLPMWLKLETLRWGDYLILSKYESLKGENLSQWKSQSKWDVTTKEWWEGCNVSVSEDLEVRDHEPKNVCGL